MNVLALGAHPDDVEFLCAGTLLKLKGQGHNIFIALTTSGNIGSNEYESREEIAEVREKEQLEAAKYYDAQVKFLRFDDEGLQDTPETRKAVLNAIRWANPDIIFTNPPWDPSTDHGMTGKLVTEMILSVQGKLVPADEPPINKTPCIFFWDIPAGMGFEPLAYVDITEYMDKKLEALSSHKSQWAWMNTVMDDEFKEYCSTLARFRGIQAGYKYAEGFIGHKILGYVADYKLLP